MIFNVAKSMPGLATVSRCHTSGMTSRRYVTVLVGIVLLGWALRIGMTAHFVGLNTAPDPADGLDQIDYDLFAYRMSVGLGYTLEEGTPTARRAPGTSLLLLPIYLLFGHSYLAAHLWITGLSAITCAIGAEFVRRRWDPITALATASVLAVHPGMTYYAMFLWSEAPFTLAAALGTWLTVRSLEPSARTGWSIAAGLVWGFAILLRPQIILMGPMALLVWMCLGTTRWQLFRPLMTQMVLAYAVTVPWVVRNAIVMDKACLATVVGGHTFWGAHNRLTFTDPQVRGDWIGLSRLRDNARAWPDGEVEQEAAAWKYAFEDIHAHASLLPQLLVAKVMRLLSPFENTSNRMVFWAFAIAWIVTIPGLVLGWRELQQRDSLLAGTIAVQFLATVACVLLFYGGGRFRHVYEPLLIAVSAIGVERMLRGVMAALRQPPATRTTLAASAQ
jgi:4-amino-4-deoxy-L-arabinose transferase-like glycosyltransferase